MRVLELSTLFSSRLGAPEITLRDLMTSEGKAKEPKKIITIEQWVVSFHTYIAVMAVR